MGKFLLVMYFILSTIIIFFFELIIYLIFLSFTAFSRIDAAEFQIKPKDIRITINQQATFNLTLE